jgi:hypothetical protein
MTTQDTRTEAERAYDSLKDGSAYFQPQPAALTDAERIALAREADRLLAAYDQQIAELEELERRHGLTDADDDAATHPELLADLKLWVDRRMAEQYAPAERAKRGV